MKTEILALLLILVVHAVLLLKLVFFPYSELFIYPYLTNHGLTPYKQILDQHFPGLMFLPINFNNLGLTSPLNARIWLICITLITQLLIFFIARKLTKNDKLAPVANLIFLILHPFLSGWTLWIDNFLPLFYLPAFYFSFKFIMAKDKKDSDLILTGFFLSLAIVFKQIALPLTFLVGSLLFYYQRNLRTVMFFLLGLLPIPLLVVVYFYFLGAIKDFWFWTVWFNLTTYAKYGRPTTPFSSLIRAWGVFSPMLLLPILKNQKLVFLLGIFLIGSLAGTLDRFDFVHFQPALPFLSLLLALILSQLGQSKVGKLLIVVYFLVLAFWLTSFFKGHLSDRVLLFDPQTMQISQRIKQLVKPNEEIFIFGPVPHLYSLSTTIPAGRIFVFQFPWFLMESENRFVQALQTSKPNLVVRDRAVEIDGQSITKFAPKLDSYIEQNYIVIDKIVTTEFLIKK